MTLENFAVQFFSAYGLFGMFLAAVIANATIFFPLPMDPLVVIVAASSSSIFFVLGLGFVVGFGAAIGEMVGYALGLLGISTVERFTKKKLSGIEEIQRRLHNKGMLFVFFAAFVPFPFDLVGIVAGLVRFNWAKFFAAAALGKILRYELLSLAGFFGIQAIKQFLTA